MKGFDLLTAFPDLNSQFHFIRVDPWDHNRVWWHTRTVATNTGPLIGQEPTNKKVELPPQANSLTFNEEGKVTQLTIGYVLDRRVGNTGGLGGAFGIFYGVGLGLPFPEGQPFSPSPQFRIFNFLNSPNV